MRIWRDWGSSQETSWKLGIYFGTSHMLQEKSWSKESPLGNRRFNCWWKGVNKAVYGGWPAVDQTFHAFMQSLAVPDWDFYIWQLSKQGIHWPVSPDRIAGSVMNPSRWSICLQLLVFKWTQAQVQFFKNALGISCVYQPHYYCGKTSSRATKGLSANQKPLL